ncbi:MAG: SDR family NAD(P)-dependent oxidoreductase, partial [Chloroflexi bacterium]
EPVSQEEEAAHVSEWLVLLYHVPDLSATALQAQMTWGKVKSWSGQPSSRAERFQQAVEHLIGELESLLGKPTATARSAGPVLVQLVVGQQEQPNLFPALVAVLKTAQQEYPRLLAQLIELQAAPQPEQLLSYLQENQRRPHEQHIGYRDGKRWVRTWHNCVHKSSGPGPWKEAGCYLISGGAGGLARLLVQEIAQQVEQASVVLIGRSALSRAQQAQLEEIGQGRIHIDYQQTDVTDGPAVHALIESILAHYGHLNGIIHAAGILRDSLLLNKTPQEVQAVLAPKVMGVEVLDEASSTLPLDFFLLCSSLAGVMGNVGQADYAAANAYLDAFAHARQAWVLAGSRHGTTVSINWPLWAQAGMHVRGEMREMMRERLGTEVMPTEVGMKVLSQALASGSAQVMVAHGHVERIKQRLRPAVATVQQPASRVGLLDPSVAEHSPDLDQQPAPIAREALCQQLCNHVCNLLKTEVDEIDAQTSLAEYGFDSITFTLFANRLNQSYQLDLSPALFYEYSTIEQLIDYLLANYAAALAAHFPTTVAVPLAGHSGASPIDAGGSGGLGGGQPPSGVWDTANPARGLLSPGPQLPSAPRVGTPGKARASGSAIAIIGMSGIFPQASDVQSLWSNLLAGRDCISEIPPTRWDWQSAFGNPAMGGKKTNIKWAGVIEDVEYFDPLFFGINKAEAEQMDPQQRLLMMYVWKAIEDAGYSTESLSGSDTALFVGTISSGYGERVFRSLPIEGHSSTGHVPSVGPNRMSYFLNLHGPSEPIETACSSSLVAIHRGVSAIEGGQCSLAIVGGINTLLSLDG